MRDYYPVAGRKGDVVGLEVVRQAVGCSVVGGQHKFGLHGLPWCSFARWWKVYVGRRARMALTEGQIRLVIECRIGHSPGVDSLRAEANHDAIDGQRDAAALVLKAVSCMLRLEYLPIVGCSSPSRA